MKIEVGSLLDHLPRARHVHVWLAKKPSCPTQVDVIFLVIRELRKEKVKERTVPNGTAHTPVMHLTVLGRTLRSA